MNTGQRLSKLLFEARELVDMYGDIIRNQMGRDDPFTRRVRDDIDAYRAEQGWSTDGFGHEHDIWHTWPQQRLSGHLWVRIPDELAGSND